MLAHESSRMSRQVFREKKFSSPALARIATCNQIIEEYLGQALRLTLRQLYYQLVTRNVIANVEREYKNLSTLVSDARLAGLMDWAAIEDRVRRPHVQPQFENLGELVDAALDSYRLPRWRGQDVYVELWVEKDALAGVLAPLAREFHVTMMVNRGYSSQSAMYEAANRFIDSEKPGKCLYLGDHDPSGEDMVRDIRDRLDMFEADVTVEKLALTMEQVRAYTPPPNPAKMTDPRATDYIAEHGNESWEVDALPPEVLSGIIRERFEDIIMSEPLREVLEQEKQDKASLQSALQSIGRKRK
jgi:hypothetical protein